MNEPEWNAGEAEILVFAIDRSRATFAWKTGGLDAEALNREFPPSAMTLGGLIKHLTTVENKYTFAFFTQGEGAIPAEIDWGWESARHDPPEQIYSRWHEAVENNRTALNRLLESGDPGQLTPYGPNLRRALMDMHDEYARHVGHADLFREAVDGLTGEDPPDE
ncbi:mycothiol transferase [Herbidospora sp. RD11066]